MILELLEQVTVGADGAEYLGLDVTHGQQVTIRRLFRAVKNPLRWDRLCGELNLLTQLQHPSVDSVVSLSLEARDPHIASKKPPHLLADVLSGDVGIKRPAWELMAQLAEALEEVHRVGLVLGVLSPDLLGVDENGRLIVDVVGALTDTRSATENREGLSAPDRFHSPKTDVFALGMLLAQMAKGSEDPKLQEVVRSATDGDPELRPSAGEIAGMLWEVPPTEPVTSATIAPGDEEPLRKLGRYELHDTLGKGGMGFVYRGVDPIGERDVAVKVLRPTKGDEESRRRFRREARLLAQLESPYLARMLDCGEDGGSDYIVMEYVPGPTLHTVLKGLGTIDETTALRIAADIARALTDVHNAGIIHRDIKPPNVIMVDGVEDESSLDDAPRCKLCDFGIALELDDDAERVTQTGQAVGTPAYMAPEQLLSRTVDARADVWAVGALLYRSICGESPFGERNSRQVFDNILHTPTPDPKSSAPNLTEVTAKLITDCLDKEPSRRPAHGGELLERIESILRGDAQSLDVHPKLPDVSGAGVMTFEHQWELENPPRVLWPFVSNTERLNRAIGLGAVEVSRDRVEGQVRTEGAFRRMGMDVRWVEHPFEWIAPYRMGVLREFKSGPLHWYRSTVELEPLPSGGTRLTHRLDAEPRGVLGGFAAKWELGAKARRGLDRVYRRIDRLAGGPQTNADPFEPTPALGAAAEARLAALEDRMVAAGAKPVVVERLGEYLRCASNQELGRIRPRVFAARYNLDERETMEACFIGAHEGMLELMWDIICPRCRIPSNIAETLREVRDHDNCEACDIEFELDFANSIEVMFRAHPKIREADIGVYCIGGPSHFPHVMAQVRLAPGERFRMPLELSEGQYEFVGRHLPYRWKLNVHPQAMLDSWELSLREGLPFAQQRALIPGKQRVVLTNDLDREVVVSLERVEERRQAVSAAEASCMPLFRKLFSSETLSEEVLVSLSHVVVLLAEPVLDTDHVEDAEMYARLSRKTRAISRYAEVEGGAIVKLLGDSVMAVFTDPMGAFRTGVEMLRESRDEPVRIAMHNGAALVTTINDRLDYFGRLVNEAVALLHCGDEGELLISSALATDPPVASALQEIPHRLSQDVGEGMVALRIGIDDLPKGVDTTQDDLPTVSESAATIVAGRPQ